MKKLLSICASLLIAGSLVATGPSPINNGILQTDLNGNGKNINNLNQVNATSYTGNGGLLTGLPAASDVNTLSNTQIGLVSFTNGVKKVAISTSPGLFRLTQSNGLFKVLVLHDSFSDQMAFAGPKGSVNAEIQRQLKYVYGDGGIGYLFWFGGFGLTPLSRAETTNFLDQVASLYPADTAGWMQNDFNLMPNQVFVNQMGFRYLTWPRGGTFTVLHTNSFITETLTFNSFSASTNVVYTNWVSPSSTNNILMFTGVSGTNIILQGEMLNTNGGVVNYHWGKGGTELTNWLVTELNFPGTLSNFFKSINPDLSLFASRHLFTDSADPAVRTNALKQILQLVQPTTNTAVAVQSCFPKINDANNVKTITDNGGLQFCIIGMTNAYYIDLFSGFTNFQSLLDAGVHTPGDGLHPTQAGALMFANQEIRQLGLNTYTGPMGFTDDIPLVGSKSFMSFRNGVYVGLTTTNRYVPAVNPSIWLDAAQGITYSGTNVTAWAGVPGSLVTLTGGSTCGMQTNAVNGFPAVLFGGSFPTTASLSVGGASRDWFVNPANHTDSTTFMLQKVYLNANNKYISVDWDAPSSGSQDFHTGIVHDGPARYQVGAATVDEVDFTPTLGFYSTWTLYTYVRSGNTMTVYTNGVQMATATATNPLNASSSSLQLGGDYNGAFIAETIIYPRVLSSYDLLVTTKYFGSKYNLGF